MKYLLSVVEYWIEVRRIPETSTAEVIYLDKQCFQETKAGRAYLMSRESNLVVSSHSQVLSEYMVRVFLVELMRSSREKCVYQQFAHLMRCRDNSAN